MGTEFAVILPAVLAAAAALATLAFEPFLAVVDKHRILPWLGSFLLAAAALAALGTAPADGVTVSFGGLLLSDPARAWLVVGVCLVGLISLAGLQAGSQRRPLPGGEPYALIATAVCGVIIMIQAGDLLAMVVGLELAGLSIYPMIAARRDRQEGAEGLLKYFVMGAVFSAVLLYGIALTYGATGSTRYGAEALAGREQLLVLGQTLCLLGLVFKVGLVPFHFWSPDAYSAAPLAITGFMGGAMKIGGFAALGALWSGAIAPGAARSLAEPIIAQAVAWERLAGLGQVLLVLGVLSIVLGAFSAIGQRSLRRFNAFSGISHAGFMTLALAVPAAGVAVDLGSLWFYVLAYALGTTATMTVASGLLEDDDDRIEGLAGAAQARPGLALGLAVMMGSLAGIPPTAGFIAKYQVLGGLVAFGNWPLALLSMLAAVVAAVAYVRVALVPWSPALGDARPLGRQQVLLSMGLVAVVAAVIALTVVPDLARVAG